MYNTAFFSETSSCLNQERNRTDQAPFTSQNTSKQLCWWILMWEDNEGWTVSLEEALL